VPSGAIVVSKSVMEDLYYASRFTQYFRFDDIFLAIIAYKMNIIPFDSPFFFTCHKSGGRCTSDQNEQVFLHLLSRNIESDSNSIKDYMIAQHGLSTSDLIKLWEDNALDLVETHGTSEI